MPDIVMKSNTTEPDESLKPSKSNEPDESPKPSESNEPDESPKPDELNESNDIFYKLIILILVLNLFMKTIKKNNYPIKYNSDNFKKYISTNHHQSIP